MHTLVYSKCACSCAHVAHAHAVLAMCVPMWRLVPVLRAPYLAKDQGFDRLMCVGNGAAVSGFQKIPGHQDRRA